MSVARTIADLDGAKEIGERIWMELKRLGINICWSRCSIGLSYDQKYPRLLRLTGWCICDTNIM